MDILMTIRPMYIERIFAGEKKYEYRRQIPRKLASAVSLIFYVSRPVQLVIGECGISDHFIASPRDIWSRTCENAGISETNFFKYFFGCKIALAIAIKQPVRYHTPKKLHDLGILRPPQSFRYLY